MTSLLGLRRHTAIISASSVSSRERVGFIDQPTTLRAKRSMTTANLPGADVGDIGYPDLVSPHDIKPSLYTIRRHD
ncbi:hypothetical protein AHGSH82_011510 [Aeromonas hydrophila]|nr:hypothetical protein AHGSH82_011510 [Aeromonas hydrophila]